MTANQNGRQLLQRFEHDADLFLDLGAGLLMWGITKGLAWPMFPRHEVYRDARLIARIPCGRRRNHLHATILCIGG
jgi:hypothetical protein